MSKFKVGVFGDRMEDVYYIGHADRISPEAPIPVVKVFGIEHYPGGAGNVVMNLHNLSVEVLDYTLQGPKPVKNRLMVGDAQVARWDLTDKCESYVGRVFPKMDAIVIADYGKGGVTKETIEKIKLLNVPVFVDTKKDPSPWNGVVTAIFPNEKEYKQYWYEYAKIVADGGHLVLKEGSKGIQFINGSGNIEDTLQSPAQARFVKSVNGAGDTVIAAFVYKWLMLQNSKMNDTDRYKLILRFANVAAAIAVENPYTYAPTLEEVNYRYYDDSVDICGADY